MIEIPPEQFMLAIVFILLVFMAGVSVVPLHQVIQVHFQLLF
jgi:hypothetical protein